MVGSSKATAAGVLATLGVSACFAALALAGVEEKPFVVDPGATERGSVECPSGESPTGGGFTLHQANRNRLRVHSSFPDGDRWKVEAYSLDRKSRGSAIALCAEDEDLFVRTKTERAALGTGEGQATARCPDGSKALGGGGNIAGSNWEFRGSFPDSEAMSWGARFEFSEFDQPRMDAFVVCDRTPRGVHVVHDTVTSDPSAGRTTVTAEAECRPNAHPVGGGHFASVSGTYYRESRPVAGAWRVTADPFGEVTVAAYAVCARG